MPTLTAELKIGHALTKELGSRASEAIGGENDPSSTQVLRRLVITQRALDASVMHARRALQRS